MTISALSTAVSGLQASAQQFRQSAHNVVNINSDNFQAHDVRTVTQVSAGQAADVTTKTVPVDETSYVREFVVQSSAKVAYAANARVISSVEESLGALLDISA